MGAYESLPGNQPVIELSSWEILFIPDDQDPNTKQQTLSIRNAGTGTLNWNIVPDCDWIDIDITNGSSTGESDIVTLEANITNLNPGNYNCTLTISDPNAVNTPRVVQIVLHSGGEFHVPAQFPSIQDAIDQAWNNDTIIVADGTYTPPDVRGFILADKQITLCSQNGPENCLIDCNDIGGRAFELIGLPPGTTLCGFTIINGYQENGGAIYCADSTLTIENCVINNCSADTGAAFYCRDAQLTISDCEFYANSATTGGAIYHQSGNSNLQNCTFTENTAENGGALYNQNSVLFLANCLFNSNSATKRNFNYGGGGIFNKNSSPLITDCNFSDNSAVWDGGAILNYEYSSPTLINCCFRGNSALGNDGGAVFNYKFCDPVFNNCLFIQNTAQSWGGAMRNNQSNPTLINCLLVANTANDNGGAVYNYFESYAQVIHCTFSGNSANGNAGDAIYNFRQSDLTATNSIFWDFGSEIIDDMSSSTVTFCNIMNSLPENSNINADPLFIAPQNEDYRLLPHSPCIDAGTDAGVSQDLSGNLRPWDYPGLNHNEPNEPPFDMGAYEFAPLQVNMNFTPPVINAHSSGNSVKAHLTLPTGFSPEDIDCNVPALLEPFGIESENMQVFTDSQGRLRLKITFSRDELCAAVWDNTTVEVTVICAFTDGDYFYGSDTIRIIHNVIVSLADLAAHWLDSSCRKPHWCDGTDLNKDSVVNFTDYAILQNHN